MSLGRHPRPLAQWLSGREVRTPPPCVTCTVFLFPPAGVGGPGLQDRHRGSPSRRAGHSLTGSGLALPLFLLCAQAKRSAQRSPAQQDGVLSAPSLW